MHPTVLTAIKNHTNMKKNIFPCSILFNKNIIATKKVLYESMQMDNGQ